MLGQGCPAKQNQPVFSRSFRVKRDFAPLYNLFFALLPVWVCAALGALLSPAFFPVSAAEPAGRIYSKTAPAAGENGAQPAGSVPENFRQLRFNLSWTAKEPRQWEGELRLENGSFTGIIPLGTESDASVTFYPSNDRRTLHVRSLAPSAYCGAQISAAAAPTASLSIHLKGAEGGPAFSRSVSLSELDGGAVHLPIDGEENELVIERAAGDRIPVSVAHLGKDGAPLPGAIPSMVFEEGETLLLRVPVGRLSAEGPAKQLWVSLAPTGSNEPVWSETESLDGVSPGDVLSISVPIRRVTGPFDVTLELNGSGGGNKGGKFFLPQNPFSPAARETPQALRRVVQGIALPPALLSDTPEYTPAGAGSSAADPLDMRDRLLDTIDPTNPSWWKIFSRRPEAKADSAPNGAVPQEEEPNLDFLKMWQWGELQASVKSLSRMTDWGRWDSLWQKPLGSGHLVPFDSGDPRDASFMKLLSSGDPADPSWESYTIPIKEPGKPHVLEIEYLPDYPQKLGVSILEPAVSGGLFPRTLDTGLIVGKEQLSDQVAHRVLRYTVLFWPKTSAPTILLMNRDTQNPAVYGRIRVYRAKDRFAAVVPPSSEPRRAMTAVMTRPTFCDQFLAENAPATAGVVGARDWRAFQQGTQRLTGYLKICGWDSLLLSVMADGSTLYPSPILRPNPQFDSGIFLTEGNDPVRKDAADYLLKTFEREHLALTPLFSFNAPLPILEAEIREAAEKSGEAGRNADYLLGVNGDRAAAEGNPGYNILHPSVQREILRTLDEFAARYAGRRALRDIALDLSADSFARLPDNMYTGLDDETVRRFARETRLEERCPEKLRGELRDFLNAQDQDRYYRRAAMIRNYLTEDWIRWRSATVSRFYHTAARLLRKYFPEARLQLVTLRDEPVEGIPSGVAPAQAAADAQTRALLRRGVDLAYLGRVPEVVWIRSMPVEPGWRSAGISADSADPYAGLAALGGEGALFYRDADPINVPSFDRVSPYHPTVTQISAVCSYSDYQNRERWAKQLAVSDTMALMDGGEMIPMGEEESQSRWIAAFRALPSEPFETYTAEDSVSAGTEGSAEEGQIPLAAGEKPDRPQPASPVILRYRKEEDGFWGYLLSTAPFHCGVTLSLTCNPRAETALYAGGRELTEPDRKNFGLYWNCSLAPYDLVAFRVADPDVSIRQFETALPIDICGEGGRLEQEARLLIDRLRLAAEGIESPLANPGFEETLPEPSIALTAPAGEEKENGSILGLEIPKLSLIRSPFGEGKPAAGGKEVLPADPIAADPGMPIGWHRFGSPEFTAELDSRHRTEGGSSLKMVCRESAGGVIGEPFPLPKTGRLYVDGKFGIPADLPEELPLFMTLAGKEGGKVWQKRVYIGTTLLRRAREMKQNGSLQEENGLVWIRNSVIFDSLPTENTEDFTLRFDLLPRGAVWVDDLHLYKLAFDRAEQDQVSEMIGELQKGLEEENTALLLRRIGTSVASALAEQLPNDSLELARLAMRDVAADPPRNRREPPQNEGETAPEGEEEGKNFFQKILPW